MDGVQLPVLTVSDYLAFRTVPPQEKYSLSYNGRSTTLSVSFKTYGASNPVVYLAAVYTSSHGKCEFEKLNSRRVYLIQM